MKLKEIYKHKDIKKKFSFEIFPPKELSDYPKLITETQKLKQLNPAFISLTWNAGGCGNSSFELIKLIKAQNFNIMPHFTCISSTKNEVLKHLQGLHSLNIENILALRGDIPSDKTLCKKDFCFANELVEFIKNNSNLSIAVAGYPEGHIDANSITEDIDNLKKKIDAGADAIITQLFFDNSKFYKYVELLRKKGITTPIIAGIMPILSQKQIDKMTRLANITLPDIVKENLEKYKDSPSDLQEFGIDFSSQQCQNLIESNVEGLHFFTLNKMKTSINILNNIL